ncbi:MAG TPA: hypothetical protein VJU61_21715 [Polyangiaceae bacterium]|nr:hypothetical protein [Polyangiaceae bacterium]
MRAHSTPSNARGWAVQRGLVSPLFGLCALGLLACGPKVYSLYAQSPESCAPEYRFTAVLSGNVLGVTLAKDNPGDTPDEIPAVLTYKQRGNSQHFELTPDPTGAGDILDAPPALLARVVEKRACLEPFEAGDSTSDVCLQSWLQAERCFDLEQE